MARLPPPNKIKIHRIYTPWEAAEALDVHQQTVRRWIKNAGLIADRTQRPWLVKGADLKKFLGDRRNEAKCKLALHRMYCLGCKLPQEPAGKFADYTHQSATTGMLTALCPTCDKIINKVVRRADIEAIRAKIDVTIRQADARLVSRIGAPLTVTFNAEAPTHVEKQI